MQLCSTWFCWWNCLTWFGVWFAQEQRNAHVRRNALRICSQTTVMNLICWLIQWLHLPLKQTVRQTEARTALRSCSPSSPVMGGSPLLALRERLCGCSRVYVWEISNDERMPFQVWTRGASVQCPTLTPYARTHMLIRRHTHLCMRVCVCVCVWVCTFIHTYNFVIDPYVLVHGHLTYMYSHIQRFATQPVEMYCDWWLWFSHLATIWARGSYVDTSPSSVLFPLIFPSSLSQSERASLFCSACL